MDTGTSSGNNRRRFTRLVMGLSLLAVRCVTGQTNAADTTDMIAGRVLIGRERSVHQHLKDGDEFVASLPSLMAEGRILFEANWTEEEGGGRPLSKGTGRPLSDPSLPLTGVRAFNRISAPDANSCAGCHNAPFGISGGAGDFVTNVFVLGQRFDFATFDPVDKLPTRGAADEEGDVTGLATLANQRATTGLFGAGYLEMLARQITEDLQAIRSTIKPGQTKELVSKGIRYGKLTLSALRRNWGEDSRGGYLARLRG